MFDYLDWRGDLSFENAPINAVDLLPPGTDAGRIHARNIGTADGGAVSAGRGFP